MASVAAANSQRDTLPSINHLDFEKYRLDSTDHHRFPGQGFHPLSRNSMSSPPTSHSGPPPPYSAGISTTHGASGYISPPETSSRRSTRDDKESPKGTNSLPSLLEALKGTEIPPQPQAYNPAPAPVPNATVPQTFGDAPKGPGNPFSQSAAPISALRSSFSSVSETSPLKPIPPPSAPSETRQMSSGGFAGSPRSSLPAQRLSGPLPPTNASLDPPFRSLYSTESSRPGYPFPDFSNSNGTTAPSQSFLFEHPTKLDDGRSAFAKPDSKPYNETVKRHLDVYDAEQAMNEVVEISAHTLEFAKMWTQRYHQANRANFADGLPNTAELDEMLRNSHRVLENLNRLREVSVMQQNAINEQRARAAQGQHLDDDYHRMPEDYKVGGGGFAGGDAKKRRGKAAPPGRCHSCQRAETPEWRRGPDGARTLCNACGLHYAKLTRKMGANKAAVLTGSNLRPKSLNETRP